MTTKTYTPKDYIPAELLCPHCLKRNPVRESRCEHCDKMIHTSLKASLSSQIITKPRLTLLMGILIGLIVLIVANKIISTIEGHMDNIHAQMDIYNQSRERTGS